MRNLAAIQEALRITRSSLAAFCERFLRIEYKENWWKYGIAACVQEDYDERGINKEFPEAGDSGDLDLQLLLKLINVYHWDKVSERLAWGQKERGLVSALINIRNLYEGHVTPNRERELDMRRTVDILDGIYDFNKLVNTQSADKIMKIIKKVEEPIVKREQTSRANQNEQAYRPPAEETYADEEHRHEESTAEAVKAEPAREKPALSIKRQETVAAPASVVQTQKSKPPATEKKRTKQADSADYSKNIKPDAKANGYYDEKNRQTAKSKKVKTDAKSSTGELEYTPIRKKQSNYDAWYYEPQGEPAVKRPPVKKTTNVAKKKSNSKSKKKRKQHYADVKRIGFMTIFVLLATIALVLLERFLSMAVEFFKSL